jgi:hypothetical protein
VVGYGNYVFLFYSITFGLYEKRIQLSQNDIAACFTRNELIILDENDNKRTMTFLFYIIKPYIVLGKARHSDARPPDKDATQWTNYFQDVLSSTKSAAH